MVPPSYKWVYKPHEYYSYLRTINHSEMGLICTNLANELGHHPVTVVAKMRGIIWVCFPIAIVSL